MKIGAIVLACFGLLCLASAGETCVGSVASAKTGDTLQFSSGGRVLEVRLVGVISPCGSQPWAGDAASMSSGFNRHGPLILETVGFDIYGRRLGWITTADGRHSLNCSLLYTGLAVVDPTYINRLNRSAREDLYHWEDVARSSRARWWARGGEHPLIYRRRMRLRE